MKETHITSTQKTVTYFEKAGNKNTNALLKVVKNYMEREDVKDVVVASTTGKTGAQASKILKGRNVVVIGHSYGFKEPGKNEIVPQYEKKILANKARFSQVPTP
jgi:hypothetical protein